jgi:hypothetical protein
VQRSKQAVVAGAAETPLVSPTVVVSTTVITTPASPVPSTPAAASSGDDDPPWAWRGVAIALLVVLAGALLWVLTRHRRKWSAWKTAAAPVVEQTHVVADLLPGPVEPISDPGRWQEVRQQAEQNAEGLDALAVSAPKDDAREAARPAARALRNLVAALEASRLLRSASAPTGAELTRAEGAVRSARADLDTSLLRLDRLTGRSGGGPQSAGATP